MKSLFKWVATPFVALALMLGSVSAAQVNQKDPQQMIIELSRVILPELQARAVELANKPAALQAFTEQYALPYIDTPRMARFIVGRSWRAASEQQQQAFVDEFTKSMLRSYSSSLLNLNIERIDVAASIPDGDGRVLIPTKILQGSGKSAEVVYRVFQERDSGNWMIYDVIVEGISVLVSFREAYSSDIERHGLDRVIANLQERNKDFK
ncbi:MlaC/ttg2D family ABC transporter substrate-binding protein [Thiomicrospira microaerophila]|uniref:MlaC/ttg2D family ABC transporter substrate-binding protein n=1 Tax=Thiomicrospira microaerophila TaxID=406020 RepID=UPI0005CA49C7|nr:ABC transporter substrate-binding protein [Thiomicrospira microaerophila]